MNRLSIVVGGTLIRINQLDGPGPCTFGCGRRADRLRGANWRLPTKLILLKAALDRNLHSFRIQMEE
jgi:hypothetical protein